AVPARPRLPPRPPARAAAAAPGRGGAAQHPLRPGRYPLLPAPQPHSFVARRPPAPRVALRTEASDGTDSVASPAAARPAAGRAPAGGRPGGNGGADGRHGGRGQRQEGAEQRSGPGPARTRPHAARRRGRRLVSALFTALVGTVLVLAGIGLGATGATVIGADGLTELKRHAGLPVTGPSATPR